MQCVHCFFAGVIGLELAWKAAYHVSADFMAQLCWIESVFANTAGSEVHAVVADDGLLLRSEFIRVTRSFHRNIVLIPVHLHKTCGAAFANRNRTVFAHEMDVPAAAAVAPMTWAIPV
jgi:hypothetical protein